MVPRPPRTATLLLLNGLPGVGKSTASAALAARRPGTLNLDIDVVRELVSGDPVTTAEPARALGLAMAVEHLRGGCDVVVPQLVARADQVARFERAAGDGDGVFVHVVLAAPRATVAARLARDEAAHRHGLDASGLDAYAAALRGVSVRPGVVVLDTDGLDADGGGAQGVVAALEQLLDR